MQTIVKTLDKFNGACRIETPDELVEPPRDIHFPVVRCSSPMFSSASSVVIAAKISIEIADRCGERFMFVST